MTSRDCSNEVFFNRIIYFFLALAVVLGIVFRLRLLDQAMQYDESFTHQIAVRGWLNVLSYYYYPNNHIFFTILSKVATSIFGDSPSIIRLPAFLPGILLIPATFFATRIFFGRCSALLASFIVASSPLLIIYSADGRGYTLLALIFLALFLLLCKTGKTRQEWLCFVLLSALGFYTHPTMLYPYLFLFISFFLLSKGCRQTYAIHFMLFSLAVTGCVLLLYAPVIARCGLDSIIKNKVVTPEIFSISEVTAYFGQLYPSFLSEGRAVQILWASLLTASLFNSNARIFLAAAALVFIFSIFVQRVLPPPRIWMFFVPVIAMIASGSLKSIENLKPFFSLPFVLFLCFIFTLGQNPWLKKTSLCSDMEKIAADLKDVLLEGSVVDVPDLCGPPAKYYFSKEGMPEKFIFWHVPSKQNSELENFVRVYQIATPEHRHPLKCERVVKSYEFSRLYRGGSDECLENNPAQNG